MPIEIRRFAPADWSAVWRILQPTFDAGDTYAFAPGSAEAEIRRAWAELPSATFVACDGAGDAIVGTYYLKPSQPGLGAHVCNCGYVVVAQARGRGIAALMCEHSQQQAIALGFRAMQFNLVVSTNQSALRLWRRLGFSVVGTLPGAFRHRRLGEIDALVLYKRLVEAAPGFSLQGAGVRLRELQPDDADALVMAASDGELWRLPFTVVPSAQTVDDYIARALASRAGGRALPLVIELLETGAVIGSTRFWKIDRENRKLEIGGTWIAASWQRSFVNSEIKLLMLRHAFEELGCVRVQFTTDEINDRSRAAILRLGAKQEGVMRHERLMPDGRKRNSVRFSIIDDEWPAVRGRLEARLARGR